MERSFVEGCMSNGISSLKRNLLRKPRTERSDVLFERCHGEPMGQGASLVISLSRVDVLNQKFRNFRMVLPDG